MPKDNSKLLKTSQIIERGWTKGLIKKFLVEPDKTHKILSTGSKAFLYNEDRVESVEETDNFKTAQEKALKRSETALKKAEKQKQKSLVQVESLEIEVERLDIDKIKNRAISSYKTQNYPAANENDDKNFIERITVNYIRHELTNYDLYLFEQYKKIGKSETVKIIRRKIFMEMLRIYPELSYQIKKQARDREIYI